LIKKLKTLRTGYKKMKKIKQLPVLTPDVLKSDVPVLFDKPLHGWNPITSSEFYSKFGQIQFQPAKIWGEYDTGDFPDKVTIRDCHLLAKKGQSNGCELPPHLLELLFTTPSFLSIKGKPRFWLTNTDFLQTLTPTHQDSVDSFLVHYFGKKQVLLLPPSSAVKAGIEKGKYSYYFSKTDPLQLAPNQEVAKQLGGYWCELNPGQQLLIPVRWVHATCGQGPTLSINLFVNNSG
jgi:hypothetical protein